MRILIGCERSGIVRDEFIRRGHEAISCDIEETMRSGPHYQGDVRDLLDYPWDLAILHPPCTHTAVSGARWFPEKRQDGRHYAGVAFFLELVRRTTHLPKVCIEHPVSVMSSLWRKPDQIIQPWQFGHGEVKATCLFLRGLPHLVPTNVVEGRLPRVHHEPPGPDRAMKRSETYAGIAEAMAEQWGRVLTEAA